MTTNQTIDGVPRADIDAACKADSSRGATVSELVTGWAAMERLRALLDAPAYPNRLCHIDYTAHPYICGCLKGDEEAQRRYDEKFGKPAAQPQGEPAVLIELVENKIYGGMHIAKWDNTGGLKEGVHRLYAEKPAPVAVVLPERKRAHCTGAISDFRTWEEAQGWNACLDEVARLNTKE